MENREVELKTHINNKKKKTIKTIKLASLTLVLFLSARFTYRQTVGEMELRDELEQEIDEMGLNAEAYSNKLRFDVDGKLITYEEAINMLKAAADECEMTDAEAYVALSSLYYDTIAQQVVGDENIPTLCEILGAKDNACDEYKVKVKKR